MEARERARAKAAAEANLLKYLGDAGDPREAARRVLFLAKSGEADLRTLFRVAAKARVTLQFSPSWATASADAGYTQDIDAGATLDEAFERHRSRMKSWNNAMRRGEEIRGHEHTRRAGEKPTMNRASGDYRRRLEWEWAKLHSEWVADPTTVLPEEWGRAASLAHLLDLVRCRRLGIPLERREIPQPRVTYRRDRHR